MIYEQLVTAVLILFSGLVVLSSDDPLGISKRLFRGAGARPRDPVVIVVVLPANPSCRARLGGDEP